MRGRTESWSRHLRNKVLIQLWVGLYHPLHERFWHIGVLSFPAEHTLLNSLVPPLVIGLALRLDVATDGLPRRQPFWNVLEDSNQIERWIRSGGTGVGNAIEGLCHVQ